MEGTMPSKTLWSSHARLNALKLALIAVPLIAAAGDASAVSTRVKLACAKDYYAHCSKYSPNSPEVRACMDSVGEKLSKGCVNALVAEGEVSGKEVAERAANLRD
jgi:hypothetical protein